MVPAPGRILIDVPRIGTWDVMFGSIRIPPDAKRMENFQLATGDEMIDVPAIMLHRRPPLRLVEATTFRRAASASSGVGCPVSTPSRSMRGLRFISARWYQIKFVYQPSA